MSEVEDAMAAPPPPPPTTTESEGTTTDEDVHLSPTCVCRGRRGDDGGGGGRIKLLCSFGGRIMPRPKDGALKYISGETRVLAVPRSIPFREMKKKLEEMFKTEVAAIKYQLLSLNEDLDVLVSVACDEDLVHMLDEYDRLEEKRSPTASPRFRVYVFPPQTTTAPPLPATTTAAAAAPASSRYAGFSNHHHHTQHQHYQRHQFQPERYVATVPVTPSGSPRYPAPSHGTVSADNSPRASAMAPEPPLFEGLGMGMGMGMGMQRVRSSPNLGSLVDAAPHQHQHAADVAGGFVVGSSPRHAGAGPLFVQHSSGHHYQHQYPAAPVHMPHPPGAAGARYVRVGNYLAPPMVPVARSSDRPFSRGGLMPHGSDMQQTPMKAALVWD